MASRAVTITLPVGLRGFHGAKNPSKLGPDHLSFTRNLDIDGGVLVKDGGIQKLNSTALGSGANILAGINWSPAAGALHDVVFLDTGALLKDTGAGTFPTTLASGLSTPSVFPPFFMVAGSETVGDPPRLFLFNEANQVQVVNGTANTAADISTPPADWTSSFPIFGVQHSNRLWAGGATSDPHRIYYSTTGNHQDFTSAGSGQLTVYPGEGERLVGGMSFSGVLLLWKYPRGIYIVDTRPVDLANWSVNRLTQAIGAVNASCIVQISNDVLFLDRTGTFHVLSATNDFGDVNTSNIGRLSDIGVYARANWSLTGIRLAKATWYASKSQAWFMVPAVGSSVNDIKMVVDLSDLQSGPRFIPNDRDVGTSIWMRPDTVGVEKPTLGDDEGFVWLADDDARNKEGAAYTMRIETSENDFSFADPNLGHIRKNGEFLEIVADVLRNTSLTVIPIWDGLEADTINFDIGSAGAALGSFTFGTDALAASGITTVRRKLTGSGKRLKLVFENTVLDDEVRISEVRVVFNTGDEADRSGYT